ncbi:DUF732 domain-containing protein [Mycolicibacterium aubagnense]|uniref:DUF732 domain-containing protein n=1 Tax=Mycolicibacterium aubagnense TaxID=319707 RepID=A0ABN5YNN1_9MYCO|nr:DUF732 domain-containing protein [Mycolicibacterium aubagnense]WGI34704.1 DUF732 domain-containing protein [Mycolicibacterium aubagnense]BBX83410.1 hypothetical protein MAUB_12830 [Mycolicibacterium aubagnense]
MIALHLRGLAFAACLAAATLAAPPAMADQGEDYLLQELRKTNLKWMAPGGEPEILGIGYDICNDWAAGVPYADEVAGRIGPPGWWSQRNARFFIALSTRSLCPGFFLNKVPPADQELIVQPERAWPPDPLPRN